MSEAAMRTLSLRPSVELPVGPRSVWGVCRNYPRPTCEPCHWRLRWGSLSATVVMRGAPKS
eukprot:5907311-Pyramimonas_sp.AAC.2